MGAGRPLFGTPDPAIGTCGGSDPDRKARTAPMAAVPASKRKAAGAASFPAAIGFLPLTERPGPSGEFRTSATTRMSVCSGTFTVPGGLRIGAFRSEHQHVLAQSGDHRRIEWGTALLVAAEDAGDMVMGDIDHCRDAFARTGRLSGDRLRASQPCKVDYISDPVAAVMLQLPIDGTPSRGHQGRRRCSQPRCRRPMPCWRDAMRR